jgi:hypothetical protein
MPIEEKEGWDGTYIKVLVSVDVKELEKLPKHDTIRDYMVCREVKGGIYRKPEIIWEMPKDKRGQDLLYKHYSLKIDYLIESILIPRDIIRNEYPDLVSISGQFCLGVVGDKKKLIKRDLLLKNILENAG